jgi:small subunit ribosomal protein S21e
MVDRLITSKDHASVQITVVDVDAEGKALSTGTTFALSGDVRAMGEGDDSINRLATQAGCEHSSFIRRNIAQVYFHSVEKRMVVPKVE